MKCDSGFYLFKNVQLSREIKMKNQPRVDQPLEKNLNFQRGLKQNKNGYVVGENRVKKVSRHVHAVCLLL